MKLYEITYTHCAPKDSGSACRGFAYAENDEQILDLYWEDDWASDDDEDDPRAETRAEMRSNMLEACSTEREDGWENAYYGYDYHSWKDLGKVKGQDEPRRSILRELGLLESEGPE